MIDATPDEVAAAIGCSPVGADSIRGASIRGVSIDSRMVRPGELFIGLPGTRTDGSEHVAEAIARGAAAAIATTPGERILRVDDPLDALTRLARWWRSQLAARVIGITGSVGKTTTRQLLAAALGETAVQSPRNFNNAIGVPLTILAAGRSTRWLAAEVGTGGPGEIAPLADLLQPDRAILTAAAAAHLDRFASVDAIAAEKATLAGAAGSSVVLAEHWPAPPPKEALTVGRDATCDVRYEVTRTPGPIWNGATFDPAAATTAVRIDGESYRAAVPRHLAASLAAVVHIARVEGRTVDEVHSGLAAFTPDAGRGRLHVDTERSVAGIDESYNASPASMLAAARHLAAVAPGRGMLVCGPMLGLGDAAAYWHDHVARTLQSIPLQRIVAVGPLAARLAASGHRCDAVDTPEAAAAVLHRQLRPGDVFLVKGSRAAAMERVFTSLAALADATPPPPRPPTTRPEGRPQ